MTPFRVPSTGGTQIGAMWIEQQRAESCRGHGAGKGGQLAAARGGGVAGAELSASQAGVGALSRWGCESAAAWQLRASLQPSSPRGVSPSGALLRAPARPQSQVPHLRENARHLHPIQLRDEWQQFRDKLIFYQVADFFLAIAFAA